MKGRTINPKVAEACGTLCRLRDEFAQSQWQYDAIQFVLGLPMWEIPGSLSQQHTYDGGHAVHTAEVALTALNMVDGVADAKRDLLLVAAVWHDVGKLDCYAPKEPWARHDNLERTGWQKVEPYYSQIGHLSLSHKAWCLYAADKAVPKDDATFIEHLILSHHGRKEWGSPVEPRTPEAWALHAADMMSSQFMRDGAR